MQSDDVELPEPSKAEDRLWAIFHTEHRRPRLYSRLIGDRVTRLLHIQPGKGTTPINAKLFVVTLNKNPQYECLSYAWGDASKHHGITVSGHTVFVRHNLGQALLRIRYPDRPRVVWVDAICISQNDLEEKAQQVGLIGDIFIQASRVLAWLGEHEDLSEYVFRGWPPPPQRSFSDWWRNTAQLQPDRKNIDTRTKIWTALLSRPYWTRTWIVQEIILAREVLVCCGSDTMVWDDFFRRPLHRMRTFVGPHLLDVDCEIDVGMPIAERFEEAAHAAELLDGGRTMYKFSDKTDYLLHWGSLHTLRMTAFSHTSCSDPRDKIYALLSLESHHRVRYAIPVDYHVSMAVLALQVIQAIFGSGKIYSTDHTFDSLIPYLELSQKDLMHMIDIVLDHEVDLHFGSRTCLEIVLEKHLQFGDVMPFRFTWQYFLPSSRHAMLLWRDDMRRYGRWPELSPVVLDHQLPTPQQQKLNYIAHYR